MRLSALRYDRSPCLTACWAKRRIHPAASAASPSASISFYFNILKFLRVFSLRTSLCPAASLCFPQRPPCSVTHGALRLYTRVTKYQVDMSNMPESKAGAGALYIGSTVAHGKKAWGGEKTLQQERFLRWRESKRAGWRMREENALRRWHQPS